MRVLVSRGKTLLARRAGAAALAAVFGSAGLARGSTTFQAAYITGTAGAASGGTAISIVGNQFPGGATVTIGGVSTSANVTSSTRIGSTTPNLTAGALYDVAVTDPAGPTTVVIPGGWMADFTDVPAASQFHAAVERMLRDRITTGCVPGAYCPNDSVPRSQMAVFLLRAEHGGDYIPPACSGVFADVECTPNPAFGVNWVEQLYAEGITGGCAPAPPGGKPSFCPDNSVTRGQMSVFLLKVYHGLGYLPPAATGVFNDVPVSNAFAPWVEELARLQVTVGCGNGNFCVDLPVTRGQMAIFMVKTYHRPEGTRFLEQASWGPTDGEISHVLGRGYLGWLADQNSLFPYSTYPSSLLWPDSQPASCNSVCRRDNYGMYPLQVAFYKNALYSTDQLRQRVGWALHRLDVASGNNITHSSQMSPYLNLLVQNAFGNYRDILYNETLNPAMGQFLNMSTSTSSNPNENYAREVMQLFSIGTELLNQDATTQNDIDGTPLPTYDQSVIDQLKLVFTGWFIQGGVPCDPAAGTVTCNDYLNPMSFNSSKHTTGNKVLFGGFPGQKTVTFSSSGFPELGDAIDAIFDHPNVGPYLARELIHSLVTSNPSPDYIERVAGYFNNDGTGVRGNLWPMVKAIMLDPEARTSPADPNYGKLKEPVQLVLNVLRAFNAQSSNRLMQSDGNINGQSSNMGESVLKPATVFSYFPQDYFAPPASAELFGPEFGIMDASTSLKRANFVNQMTFSGGINPSPPDTPNGTSIDMTELQQLAPNPTSLVDRLNRLLMHGTMSDDMRTSVIGAVNAVTPSTDTLKRARQALYLVATSSQYQAQR